MGKSKVVYSYCGNHTWKTIRKCLPPVPRKIESEEIKTT
jgi:hypothetical protein